MHTQHKKLGVEGAVSQSIKYLAYKYKDLSTILRTHKNVGHGDTFEILVLEKWRQGLGGVPAQLV